MAGLDDVRRVMCLAYHQGVVYPSYQWVIVGSQADYFNVSIQVQVGEYICGRNELERALTRAIFWGFRLTSFDRENITDLGIPYNDFIANYSMKLNELNRVNKDSSQRSMRIRFFPSLWHLTLPFQLLQS